MWLIYLILRIQPTPMKLEGEKNDLNGRKPLMRNLSHWIKIILGLLLIDLEEKNSLEVSGVFKKKPRITKVEAPRFKARLVAKWFFQVEGVDYHEFFSLVVKHTSIKILLAITAIQNLELEQLDVKTAFLHGNRKEKILMTQPEGFVEQEEAEKVCLLQKSVYGPQKIS